MTAHVDALKAKPTSCRIEFATERPNAFRRLLAWSAVFAQPCDWPRARRFYFSDPTRGATWPMSYQYKREPLTADEANRLASACTSFEEKLIVWTLLDTGLRVAELAGLTKGNLDWQSHRIMIYGKGGPYGTNSKRRVIPLSARVQ